VGVNSISEGSDLKMASGKVNTRMIGIASIFRGLYARVASRLDVHPSYVSRVARGERQSEAIEAALDREANQIMKRIKTNHIGSGRIGNSNPGRDGHTHQGRKTKRAVAN
jgi:hypothetical protein